MSEKKPHKWADVIKAWADGEQIQYRSLNYDLPWQDFNSYSTEMIGHGAYEWRVKPVRPKYRVAMYCEGSRVFTHVANDRDDEVRLQSLKFFVRWLTDWIEYEA